MNEPKRPVLEIVTNLRVLFKLKDIFAFNMFIGYLKGAGFVKIFDQYYNDDAIFSEFLSDVWEIKVLGKDLLINYKGEKLQTGEYFTCELPMIIKNYESSLPEALYKKYLNIPG